MNNRFDENNDKLEVYNKKLEEIQNEFQHCLNSMNQEHTKSFSMI